MKVQLLIIFVVVGVTNVAAHIKMMNPPNRASLWRFPEFGWANPEINSWDDELWCGATRQFENDTRCGICGDPVEDSMPRDMERGGRYGKNIIARNYTSGQEIDIHVQQYSLHGGYFQVQLCTEEIESESCFQPLLLGNGKYNWEMSLWDFQYDIHTTAKLPDNVRCCGICTLRLHHRGAHVWGTCDDSLTCECDQNSGGGMGCSQQETYRSCADITIN